jgi:hypothetical protein
VPEGGKGAEDLPLPPGRPVVHAPGMNSLEPGMNVGYTDWDSITCAPGRVPGRRAPARACRRGAKAMNRACGTSPGRQGVRERETK